MADEETHDTEPKLSLNRVNNEFNLTGFIELAREKLDEMESDWEEQTGESADEHRPREFWLEQLENAIHND